MFKTYKVRKRSWTGEYAVFLENDVGELYDESSQTHSSEAGAVSELNSMAQTIEDAGDGVWWSADGTEFCTNSDVDPWASGGSSGGSVEEPTDDPTAVLP